MEPFLDGGLFEVLLVVGVGYLFNFIFKQKYLLVVYCVLSLALPILILFKNSTDLLFILVGISLLNSGLLTVLLWNKRLTSPQTPLFETQKYLSKFLKKKRIRNVEKA